MHPHSLSRRFFGWAGKGSLLQQMGQGIYPGANWWNLIAVFDLKLRWWKPLCLRSFGIYRLSDPGGMEILRGFPDDGFHPHKHPEDGSPIYKLYCNVHQNSNIPTWDLKSSSCDRDAILQSSLGFVSKYERIRLYF